MSEQVRCTRCGEVKSSEMFAKSHTRQNRTGERVGTCRSCNTELQKEVRHRNHPSSLDKVEHLSIVCSICNTELPATDFRWNSRTGYRGECKKCEETLIRCSSCKEVKAHELFPPCKAMTTGRHSLCNDCHLKRMQEKYHNSDEHREKARQYSQSEAGRRVQKKTRDKPAAKARVKKYNRVYGNWKYHNDPERKRKHKARQAVNLSIAYGLIVKPAACQHPGKYSPKCGGQIQGHHHKGYEQEHWLEVEWLCTLCHKAADKAVSV